MTMDRNWIMCVDDENIPLLLRTRVLEKAGFRVTPVSSASEALNLLETKPVNLVLTDLLMPGMSGAEFAREIKARRPDLPVVIVSGVTELPPDASWADLFISKLEGPTVLSDKLWEILKQAACND